MKKGLIAIIAAGCLTLGISTGYFIGKDMHAPEKAYAIWDFNLDGRTDITIEKKNGEKINLYSLEKNEYGEIYPFKYYESSK